MNEVINLEEYAERQVEILDGAISEVQQEMAQLRRVHDALVERRIMWADRVGQVAVETL